jgi:hypothetical protein
MLKHYSHIGTEAERCAVQALVAIQAPSADGAPEGTISNDEIASATESAAKESPKGAQIH